MKGTEGTQAATRAIAQLDAGTKKASVSSNALYSNNRRLLGGMMQAQNVFFRGAFYVSRFAGANKALADSLMFAAVAFDVAIGGAQAWMAISRFTKRQNDAETVSHVLKWTAASGGILGPVLLAALGAVAIGTLALLATNTPKAARGGIIASQQLVMAGETQPEVIMPVADLMGGGRGGNVNLFIDGRNIRDALQKQSLVDWYAGRG